MSRRDYRPPEYWQSGQEYWIYMPSNLSHFSPAGRFQNPRGQISNPWWIFEERSYREPNFGLASLPSVAPARHTGPLFLIDEYNTYPGSRTHTPPAYHAQGSSTEDQESRLSPQQQKQALNKLRKQFYSPHISNIIMRLGTKSSGRDTTKEDHDEMKRCAVCLDDFESKQFVTITPCNHMFHEDCIVPWVKSQGKCPVCRYNIIS